ncbi:MAG: TOBE domain-containing protein [Desulfurellaceae bacterium]|nr:TOBE domain-containing protein [Desulfurellaceae bacterium]
MDVSARNKLPGQVKEVKLGQVMAEITLKIGENEVVAVVTKTSAERLGLKVGDEAYALVKATEIMVGKD